MCIKLTHFHTSCTGFVVGNVVVCFVLFCFFVFFLLQSHLFAGVEVMIMFVAFMGRGSNSDKDILWFVFFVLLLDMWLVLLLVLLLVSWLVLLLVL